MYKHTHTQGIDGCITTLIAHLQTKGFISKIDVSLANLWVSPPNQNKTSNTNKRILRIKIIPNKTWASSAKCSIMGWLRLVGTLKL